MGVVEPVQVPVVHAFAESVCAGELVFARIADHRLGDAGLIGTMYVRRSSQLLRYLLTLVCRFP